MAKRLQTITQESIDNLYGNHPYLLLLQKSDWKDYLLLIAQIYDLLEEEQSVVPYETLRSLLIQHYSAQNLQSPEQKATGFVSMAIVELRVLKDRYDNFGQRYIETTREGKELLKLIEQLLSQKARYTGLTADTLLVALNNLLLQQHSISETEAIEHHREKIKAYQDDIKRIQKHGVNQSELLPGDFSKEELLQQAEESALHILTAVEDVKLAIEKVRRQLADDYFKESRTAGQSINLVVDFYQSLEQTAEYRSYVQAFDLLSQIDGLGGRFRYRDVDEIVNQALAQKILERSAVERSHLNGFKSRFYRDHKSIQEKRKSQLQLLQQQVLYAISTETKVVEKEVREILSLCYQHKEDSLDYLAGLGPQIKLPFELSWGDVSLNEFDVPIETQGESLTLNELSSAEAQSLARALLEAEEATIQKTLARLRQELLSRKIVRLSDYRLEWGVTEYYVLSEIDLFCRDIAKNPTTPIALHIQTRYGVVVIKDGIDIEYSLKESPC